MAIFSCTSKCNQVNKCKNDSCFWRQRDIFQRNPFWTGDDPNIWNRIGDYLAETYGCSFPNMTARVGTNCMYVICDSYTEEESVAENDPKLKTLLDEYNDYMENEYPKEVERRTKAYTEHIKKMGS